MHTHYLGHIVFYVRDLKESLEFYEKLLGLKRIEGGGLPFKAAALTSGRTHHELLRDRRRDTEDLERQRRDVDRPRGEILDGRAAHLFADHEAVEGKAGHRDLSRRLREIA